jgi:peptide deformylase
MWCEWLPDDVMPKATIKDRYVPDYELRNKDELWNRVINRIAERKLNMVVIDVGEGPIVMINPKILETSGSQTGSEGCLSVPGKNGTVTRPMWVKAEFYGEDMEKYVIEGEELLARAICHELDHLEGKLYVDLVEGKLRDNEIDGYGDEDEE